MKKAIAALAATIAQRNETQTLEHGPRHGTGAGTATPVSRAASASSTPAVPAVKVDPLNKTEKAALKKFEGIIEIGIKVFLQVGEALTAIRDERLYRETHPTFEAYCRERWGFSKTHANRLIQSAGVAKNLAPIGVVPTSESQVRVLSAFAPMDQVKVYKNALKIAEGDPNRVTAKAVTDAAEKLGLKAVVPQSTGTSSGAGGGSRQASNDQLVNRDAVVEALSDWAEQNWEKVSHLSVADFISEVKKVVKKL